MLDGHFGFNLVIDIIYSGFVLAQTAVIIAHSESLKQHGVYLENGSPGRAAHSHIPEKLPFP